jgi:hypothetical protein
MKVNLTRRSPFPRAGVKKFKKTILLELIKKAESVAVA